MHLVTSWYDTYDRHKIKKMMTPPLRLRETSWIPIRRSRPSCHHERWSWTWDANMSQSTEHHPWQKLTSNKFIRLEGSKEDSMSIYCLGAEKDVFERAPWFSLSQPAHFYPRNCSWTKQIQKISKHKSTYVYFWRGSFTARAVWVLMQNSGRCK